MTGTADGGARSALAIAALALLAWWPLATYWQSDDFLAVTYAHSPARALRDLAGNQYGAPALVYFYRPLITLAFAVDIWLGGGAPLVAHLSNAVAHALSTLLTTWLGRRLLGRSAGSCLGVLWAVWPAHAGSILWAVGRVDSHTTVWILLCLALTLRWVDAGMTRRPWSALGAFALALLSKELAWVTPGLVALLAGTRARPLMGSRGTRLATAARAAVPFALLFAAYLGWRWLVLGHLIGGYAAAPPLQVQPALVGLATWTARLVNPLLTVEVDASLRYAGYAAILVGGVAACARGHGRAVAALALGFVLCAAPTAPFWAETAEVKNLRYFYLASTCALGVIALGGRGPTALALLIAAWPWWQVRSHYSQAQGEAAQLHAGVRARDADAAPGPFLIEGLPRQNSHGDVLMFHLFVDRLLAAPFGSGRRVFALRPLVERPGAILLAGTALAQLRDAHALTFDAHRDLRRITASDPPVAELAVTLDAMLPLDAAALLDLHADRRHDALRMPGDHSPQYRVTILTGGGYLCTVLANESPAAASGTVTLHHLLTARYAQLGDDAVVLLALTVPIGFDLEPRFPVFVEGGDLAADGVTFNAQARAPRLVELEFTRAVAGALGR